MPLFTSIPIGNFDGIGPLGNIPPGNSHINVLAKFTDIISLIIGVMTVAGGLWFVFQIFTGAVSWIAAANDKQALDNARKRITHAITGLLVLVLSYALIGIIGAFVGLDIINLQELIYTRLEPK